MNILANDIDSISGLALEIMQAILSKESRAKQIMEDESGPLVLARALSDYFQMAAALESGYSELETEELNEFGAYGLDLLDRQAYLVRQLELMDQRGTVARVIPSLALWLVRRGATIDNLEGTADGFGMLVNGLSDQQELAAMCRIMDEVIEAASEELQRDEDRSNAWRPWRVINLNTGIAATRSLDAELMARMFDKLGRRLPHDMPGFLADGRRQMMTQNVPEAVQAVMDRYVEMWPDKPPH